MKYQRLILSPVERSIIYDKTKGHCAYCGVWLETCQSWTVEHMTPKIQGGSDDLSNLVPSCNPCNRLKGQKDVEEFRAYMAQTIMVKIRLAAERLNAVSVYLPDKDRQEIESILMHTYKVIKSKSTKATFYFERTESTNE